MADESLHTMEAVAPEYQHWMVTSLQEKARTLGLNYKGLTKDQLVQMLEETSQQQREDAGTDRRQAVLRGDGPELQSTSGKSPWVMWYEEEMAILGKDATLERKLAAMEKAQKRQTEWEAAKYQAAAPVAVPVAREAQRISRKDFKPYQEHTGDVDGFFQDFEYQCELLEVPPTDWTRHVVGLLDGGAAEAYRIDPLKRRNYEEIKRAVLDYYTVSSESYQAQFRTTPRLPEASFKMFAHKLSVACHRWLEGEKAASPEQIFQAILKEQFLFKCPLELRQWVREWKPATLEEAATLADVRNGLGTGGGTHLPCGLQYQG